jgi:acyl-[acyl-carrier-protein]-phospholipid O-acyltransferase/long-chain-fatty-acid--[acyl-carrier-protein] ligase
MRFQVSNLAIDAQTWRLIRTDRIIFKVLMITSIFWLVSGAIQQAVNGFAKYQLKLNDSQTGLMLSGVAIGIAVGCLLAGKVSKGEINFRVYKVGNAGIVLTLIALGIIGVMGPDLLRRIEGPLKPASAMAGVSDVESAAKETLASEGEPGSGSASTEANAAVGWHVWACGFLLFLTGVSAGLFSVPLQTFLQVRPPDEEKGRVIAAMNLFNWIGILLAAALYFVVSSIIAQAGWPQAVHFLACAGVMALLFLYRIDGKSAPPRPATGVHG